MLLRTVYEYIRSYQASQISPSGSLLVWLHAGSDNVIIFICIILKFIGFFFISGGAKLDCDMTFLLLKPCSREPAQPTIL